MKDYNLKISDHLVINQDLNGNIYAYNSLFGGLKKLTPEEYNFIKLLKNGEPLPPIKEEIIESLLDRHFINNYDLDEYELITPILNNYKDDVINGDSISKLLLYVTGNCMLRCSYCYLNNAQEMNDNNDGLNCGMKNMEWKVAKEAIDVFFEIIKKNGQKKVHIRFHGGEPFLNFPVIKKSIEYINEKFSDLKVIYHVNTNGIAMTDDAIDFWIENSNNKNHSTDIEFSIDGPKECHDSIRKYANGKGSFEKGMKTIKKLIEKGYPLEQINIATTLTKYNYTCLHELIDETKKVGLNAVEINTLIFDSEYDFIDKVDERVNCLVDARIYGASNGVKVSGKWFKLLERLTSPVLNYCGRMGQQFAVDLDGNVFLCTGYFRNFGKIKDWEKIISNQEYINLCSRIVGQIDDCKNCEIECVCAGGCPASAEYSYGSFYSKESKECEFRKKIVKELIKNIDNVTNDNVTTDIVDSSYVPTLNKYRTRKR